MAKIQLRQKKRFSALGTKPVKKSEPKEQEQNAETENTDKETTTDKNEEKATDSTDHTDKTPVNTAASYKQTMVPNSVRKRLRAEKRAAKGAGSSQEETTTETGTETTQKRLGNLFNLGARPAEEVQQTNIEIIKPQAIGEVEHTSEQVALQPAEGATVDPARKNRSKDREFENLANNIQEFSVDAFTQESERLKAEGKLDEYRRPLTAIGGGKHQITSLLRQAQDNKEQLEASYSQNRLTQKESGAKYGF
ncbi:hypothetical protein CJU89_6163 [Yarrowia sp. B02]|nr:hypothetical protein CJU89_6163 [Yarrowia sp. B02]